MAIFLNKLKEERMFKWLGVVHLSVNLVILSETGTIIFVQFQDFKIGTSARASSLRSKILFLGKGPVTQWIYWWSGWWFQIFYSHFWRAYFSKGLVQPPTRYSLVRWVYPCPTMSLLLHSFASSESTLGRRHRTHTWVVATQIFFIFIPFLGKWSNLTDMFFRWVETTN